MYDDEDSLRNDLEEDSEHVNVNNVASTDSNLHRERVQQLYYTNPITTAANLIPTYAPSPLAAVPQVNGHEDSLKNISTQTNNVLNAPPMQVAQVIVPMAPVDHVVIPEVIPVAEIKEVFVVPEPIVNPVVIETKEVERQEIRSEKIRSKSIKINIISTSLYFFIKSNNISNAYIFVAFSTTSNGSICS